MENQNLSKKTITKHVQNVEFYLNEFLTYYEVIPMELGASHIDEFLGNWFIRKAMWSSISSINENCTSLKKFYECMLINNLVEEIEYFSLCSMIKLQKKQWHQNFRDYYGDFEYYD